MKYIAFAAMAALPLAASATGPASPWSGRTWLVANNGLDSTTCGVPATPCRSIGQAITNAADGDTIIVRPGRYGDLNEDGTLGGPGEERPTAFMAGIEINKRLRVLSTDGAESTIIDFNGAMIFDIGLHGVAILASGVQFGERDAGFTLTAANANGIMASGVGNVVIAGNVIRKSGARPDPTSMVAIYAGATGPFEVRDNLIVDNPSGGLVLLGTATTGFVSVHDNVISGSNFGQGSTGVTVADASPHLVYRNAVTDNSYGLAIINGAARITSNVISGNRDGVLLSGFLPAPPRGTTFQRNSFLGNANYGLYITNGMPPGITIRENNFYGNGSGCGIASQSANSFEAKNNFWGSATGPSNTDPADGVCAFQGSVNTTPFATREFQVR